MKKINLTLNLNRLRTSNALIGQPFFKTSKLNIFDSGGFRQNRHNGWKGKRENWFYSGKNAKKIRPWWFWSLSHGRNCFGNDPTVLVFGCVSCKGEGVLKMTPRAQRWKRVSMGIRLKLDLPVFHSNDDILGKVLLKTCDGILRY